MSTERTGCGEPRAADAGTRATVYGFVAARRDHGALSFLDVRDHTGILQVVLNPDHAAVAHRAAKPVRGEWVVSASGELQRRGDAQVNPKLATGEVELLADSFSVLSEARTPPFSVDDDGLAIDERLRLRHRYLDLRRPRLQANLRARARFISGLRQAFDSLGFSEIETPMLIRATPEGARDYLVPSRVSPGHFYALPQSPQLYKQLCMVAGLDRYYQLARCLRDEDLRADRQPEFTQLDMEMSFVDEEDVAAVLEQVIPAAWSAAGFRDGIAGPWPRISWHQAMERYGVDKPDVRFGLELHDLTEPLRSTGFRVVSQVVASGGVVKGICVPGGADLTRAVVEGELLEVARAHGARGLAPLWRRAGGNWEAPIAKFLSADELAAVGDATGAGEGDCVLIVADAPAVVAASLGALRNHLGRRRSLYDPAQLAPIWVTDFPMFEPDDEGGGVRALHHPFTMLNTDDIDLLESEPLRVRSRAYDIVLNGREIGSGSIRITDASVQRRVFRALGIDDATAEERFGFLLEAFEYGVPPHGGFAFGVERMVMEGLREESIREVIAFPKNQQAQEVMTEAPAPVDAAQLAELGIALRSQERARD